MGMRVLVVDDQEDVLNTLMRFLSLGGHEPVGLTRFADAKQYIEHTPPDALVTDVRLGAFNGLQLALHLRIAQPTAPIVVLSAWDDTLLRQEAETMGAQYHLKPLSKDQLLEAIGSAQVKP
jgi:DNA-binding response OmpR family regulator